MEIGTQIKQYRNAAGMNQEELAQAVYVTRQTLSNWETGKTYPDINSLLRLSDVFHVSLDELVKGDITKMKEQIKQEDIRHFNRESYVFAVLMLVMILSAVPLTAWRFPLGGILWLIIVAVTIYTSFRVEKLKKKYDIQTYKEIVAFTEGRYLDEIDKAREEGKRMYQKVFLVLVSALAGALVAIIF